MQQSVAVVRLPLALGLLVLCAAPAASSVANITYRAFGTWPVDASAPEHDGAGGSGGEGSASATGEEPTIAAFTLRTGAVVAVRAGDDIAGRFQAHGIRHGMSYEKRKRVEAAAYRWARERNRSARTKVLLLWDTAPGALVAAVLRAANLTAAARASASIKP